MFISVKKIQVLAIVLLAVVVGRRIHDREVASSIPGCSAARCNSGQVVHTRVPLFTKQYKLVPASAGGRVHPELDMDWIHPWIGLDWVEVSDHDL